MFQTGGRCWVQAIGEVERKLWLSQSRLCGVRYGLLRH